MNRLATWIGTWATDILAGWNRFWFSETQPHTLALIRILAGSMLFYTHAVWTLDLMAFLGPDGWLPNELARNMHGESAAWSYLWYFESPVVLGVLHLVALIIFLMLTVGFFTRITSVLAWLITLAYCHRLTGAFFGLDQVNAMLAMYVMVGPSGAVYSVDRWLSQRRAGQGGKPKRTEVASSISANVAIRLIQLHMCVIYMFGGISKMRGELWWDGSAVWYAIANLEYQSLDMTWLVHSRWLIALLSHVTVLWETFYCALVWPKRTRPIVLLIAVGIHGGIGLFLGMWTFGLAMLIANLAFISPEATRGFVTGVLRRRTGIGGGAGRLEEEVSTPTENVAVRRKQRKRSRNQAV
jgi:hypothetical protein